MHSGILAAREERARKDIAAGLFALCEAHGVAFTEGPNVPVRNMTNERRLYELEAIRDNVEALCGELDVKFERPVPAASGDTVFAKPGPEQPTAEGLAKVAAIADRTLSHITSGEGKPVMGETVFVKQPIAPPEEAPEADGFSQERPEPSEPLPVPGEATLTVDGETILINAATVTVDGQPVTGVPAETDADPGPAEQIDAGDPPAEPIAPPEEAPEVDERPTVETVTKGKKPKK